jgi:hypothetical protein
MIQFEFLSFSKINKIWELCYSTSESADVKSIEITSGDARLLISDLKLVQFSDTDYSTAYNNQ